MVYKTELQFVIVKGGRAYTILRVYACSKVVYIGLLSFLNSIVYSDSLYSLQGKLSFKFWQAEVQIGFRVFTLARQDDKTQSAATCTQLLLPVCSNGTADTESTFTSWLGKYIQQCLFATE